MSFRCGAVALVGKPNVGKSTLTNLLVGQKVTIVSNKPQTTRVSIRGIVTTTDYQVVLVDTPGLHAAHTELQKLMNKSAAGSLGDVDLVLVVVDASRKPDKEDETLADMVSKTWKYPYAEENPGKSGILLCLNKMDRLKAEDVVEHTEAYMRLFNAEESMLTCLTKRLNHHLLLKMIVDRLPEQEALFPEDAITDSPMRSIAAELVREKALALTQKEVPHSIGVMVDHWEDEPNMTTIHASIIVEKQGQKAIIIGRGGSMIKQIGTQARLEIEEMIGRKVNLDLTVKVRPEWRQSARMLHELDYL
ncbi:MAG: GTPase Era [Chthonomonas sp.]|nr:GTPase Era [Chthonomonas sp.]